MFNACVLALCLVAPAPVRAFAFPETWELRIDDRVARLELAVARTGRDLRQQGVRARGTWDGQRCELSMLRRGETSSVVIGLVDQDGRRIRCRGVLARGDPPMMAGTCTVGGEPEAASLAWCATAIDTATADRGREVRAARAPVADAIAERLAACEAQANALRKRADELALERDRATAELAELRRRPAPSPAPSAPSIDAVLVGLNGRYATSLGKQDQVTALPFPTPPTGGEATWLATHSDRLRAALGLFYSHEDLATLARAEQERCGEGGVYCRMALRQQAVARLLAALAEQKR